jgi:hypothetical protein
MFPWSTQMDRDSSKWLLVQLLQKDISASYQHVIMQAV